VWTGRESDYPRILAWIQEYPWAVLETSLHEITRVLARRSAGERLSEAEISAVIEAKSRPRENASAPRSIAVLNLYGLIMPKAEHFQISERGTSADRFGVAFQKAMDDPSIAAIVLNVDSPGGSVYGIPELAKIVRDYGPPRGKGRKKVVAVANPLEASAAWWIGSQADWKVAGLSSDIGSQGVFSIHIDESERLKAEGLNPTIVRAPAGGFKAEFIGTQPLSEESKARMQERADAMLRMFIADVAAGRGVSQRKAEASFGQGRVFSAKEALAAGMIDEIGTLSEVILDLSSKAGRGTRAKVVPVSRPTSDDDDDFAAQAADSRPTEGDLDMDASELKAMLDEQAKTLEATVRTGVAPLQEAVSAAQDAASSASESVKTLATELAETKAALAALDAKNTAATEESNKAALRAELDALAKDSRLLPAEIDSELAMLVKATPDEQKERLALIRARPKLIAGSAAKPFVIDLGGEHGKVPLGVPAEKLRRNPQGYADLATAYSMIGGKEKAKENPDLLLDAGRAMYPNPHAAWKQQRDALV
jgi:signal peptide peptidase SppA